MTPAEAAEARGARPTGGRAGGLRKFANGEEQRMNSFKNCLKRAKKRPGLFAFVALATLALTIVEQYNSWTRQYAHFSTFKGFDYVAFLNDLANRFLTFFKTPRVAALTLGAAALLLFAGCVILGLLFSGFFNQLSGATFDKPRRRGEYRVGIGRYTFKLAVYFFITIILTLLVATAVLYSAIPAIMSVKLFFLGSAGMLLPMILMCVVSLVAAFFALTFFVLYITYMIPSLIYFRRGGVGVAFRMVNGYCWYLMPRTLLYLLISGGIRVLLWAIHYGLASRGAAICIMVATWMLRTIVNYLYVYFVFDTFSAMKGDMFDSD